MSKKNSVMILAHILVVVWMIFIFYMSAQPGDVSGDISGSVSHIFMKVWNAVSFRGWSEAEILHMAEVWDYPIRKLAHMTEFGILAMLVYWTLGCYGVFGQKAETDLDAGLGARIQIWFPAYRRYIVTWILVVIYAATDEIHQLFVPDRSGNAFDVCVDATGAALALLVVWGIHRVVEVCKHKTQAKNMQEMKK